MPSSHRLPPRRRPLPPNRPSHDDDVTDALVVPSIRHPVPLGWIESVSLWTVHHIRGNAPSLGGSRAIPSHHCRRHASMVVVVVVVAPTGHEQRDGYAVSNPSSPGRYTSMLDVLFQYNPEHGASFGRVSLLKTRPFVDGTVDAVAMTGMIVAG